MFLLSVHCVQDLVDWSTVTNSVSLGTHEMFLILKYVISVSEHKKEIVISLDNKNPTSCPIKTLKYTWNLAVASSQHFQVFETLPRLLPISLCFTSGSRMSSGVKEFKFSSCLPWKNPLCRGLKWFTVSVIMSVERFPSGLCLWQLEQSVIILILWLFWTLTTSQHTQMLPFFNPHSLIKDQQTHLISVSSPSQHKLIGKRLCGPPCVMWPCNYSLFLPFKIGSKAHNCSSSCK